MPTHDGGEALALHCDVTDEDSVRRAVDATAEHFGRLDGAFNNAGGPGGQRLLHQLDTGCSTSSSPPTGGAPFLCMKYEIPAMLASGGGSALQFEEGPGCLVERAQVAGSARRITMSP